MAVYINGRKTGSEGIRVKDVEEYISRLAGGLSREEEGILFGLPDAEVKKMLVCWMADIEAIKYAVNTGASLMITHESLFYPYNILDKGGVADFMAWHTNHNRIELLAANGISVIRAHGSLDRVCIFDDFASLLGLGEPVLSEPGFVKVYEIKPVAYGELITRVKKALDIKITRVTKGDRNRRVSRIGLPWGGLGLFVNAGYMQKLVDRGCDVFIAGETDNYGMRFAIDAGIDMIETGHEISENPGLKRFAGILADAFRDIPVEFFENRSPFEYE